MHKTLNFLRKMSIMIFSTPSIIDCCRLSAQSTLFSTHLSDRKSHQLTVCVKRVCPSPPGVSPRVVLRDLEQHVAVGARPIPCLFAVGVRLRELRLE